jgi:hypothetical protein
MEIGKAGEAFKRKRPSLWKGEVVWSFLKREDGKNLP